MQKIIKPSKQLSDYIEYYFLFESQQTNENNISNRVYPCGNITLVFHFGDPYKFKKKNEAIYTEPRTVVCGQQTTYYDLFEPKNAGMIFVLFKPFGASRFFDVPMNHLKNMNIPFEDLVNKESDEIEDKIQNTKCNQKRIEIIEKYLLSKLKDKNRVSPSIENSINIIDSHYNDISVKTLAAISNLSIKHFERKFTSQVGLTPKKYQQIVRFNKILKAYNNVDKKLISMALSLGYYDQSHFINDIKSITGLSPRKFLNTLNY